MTQVIKLTIMKRWKIEIIAVVCFGLIIYSSCTETEARNASAVLVVTGNVNSQLDPCG
ncbi:MAG: hypothetical protein IIB44_06100 [Candidatus Marinimicrobia bacterium]|nr:hypothetical protein [Candidatus Neomarinimicrobiota bacterium]